MYEMPTIENSNQLRCAVLTHHLFKADGQPNTALIERLATDDLLKEFNCFSRGTPSVSFAKMQYAFPHTADSSMGYLSDNDINILLEREHAYRKQKSVQRELIELSDKVGKEPCTRRSALFCRLFRWCRDVRGTKEVYMSAMTKVRDEGEWSRVPRVGEKLEGQSRTNVFWLIRTGEIKSVAIRAKGAKRAGQRLVHVPSLRAWVVSHVEGPISDAATKGGRS